jgi:hypothetical protein
MFAINASIGNLIAENRESDQRDRPRLYWRGASSKWKRYPSRWPRTCMTHCAGRVHSSPGFLPTP